MQQACAHYREMRRRVHISSVSRTNREKLYFPGRKIDAANPSREGIPIPSPRLATARTEKRSDPAKFVSLSPRDSNFQEISSRAKINERPPKYTVIYRRYATRIDFNGAYREAIGVATSRRSSASGTRKRRDRNAK